MSSTTGTAGGGEGGGGAFQHLIEVCNEGEEERASTPRRLP